MLVLCQNEWTSTLSHFVHILYGHHSTLSSPIAVTKFRGEPLNGGVKYKGGFFVVALYRPLCRKLYEIGLVIMEPDRKSQVADRSVLVPVTLKVVRIFWQLSIITLERSDLE